MVEHEPELIDQRQVLLGRHWHNLPLADYVRKRKPNTERGLTIAISREVGSLGSEIARELGRRLDWPVYDREILELIAQRAVLRTELLSTIDEDDSSWFGELMRSIGHPEELSRAGYLHHLTKVITALAAQGACILVGRGAAAMLPSASTLKIRVVAPVELRIDRVARILSLPRVEAKAYVERMDQNRRQFVYGHFRRDVDDPHNFDLVLNSERYTSAELAEVAWVAVRARLQKQAEPELSRS